ncbi:MAG: MBL fold metallo-hydrolase [Verrucomicrobiales bacterium]|nr:MBL fold metallo-hydrolase [Verrucomicrobiales bacterium]
MTPAHLQDDALLADIRSAPCGPEHFSLWWLGQSGFLLHWNGHFAILDPYLSDSLTKKYAATDKPHVRISERVIDPSRLDMASVVTASHVHTDHLDAETLVPLVRANPHRQLVLPAAIAQTARQRLGADCPLLVELDAGMAAKVGAFTFHGIAAAHNTVERDAAGRCHFLGFVVQFGRFAVYHSGDTLWHSALVPSLLPFAVDAALVPINGNRPERRVAGNLNGTEAAALAKAIGAGLAVPHHFDMFAFNTESPEEFCAACRRLEQPFRVLRGGERVDCPLRAS